MDRRNQNFRIKLDLSNFYSDIRRCSWIYIDSTKMLHISDLKNHITELFNIKEPFHLLQNDTIYLPPKEDIRILDENEIILVLSGSESNEGNLSPNTVNFINQMKRNISSALENSSLNSVQQIQSDNSLNESQNDTSNISYIVDDSETTNIFESNVNQNANSTEQNDVLNTFKCPKRKRTRRKKKNQHQVEQPVAIKTEEHIPRKPKITYTCAIPSAKHIRFDDTNTEPGQLEMKNGIAKDEHFDKASDKLSNLLALGQNSVPLTFKNSRMKKEVNAGYVSDEKPQLNTSENRNKDATVNIKLELETDITNKDESHASICKGREQDMIRKTRKRKEIYTSNKALETCPRMNRRPELNDTVAFKMLKIGSDYTPQVSDFIVGEVICYDSEKSMYTFKILRGSSEIRVPIGKFSIYEEDDVSVIDETIAINYAQMMDTRIIGKCN